MRLRTFDDGGRLRVSACRRYQGSMSTSLPADGCGRLYHNRLLPCGVQKEAATAATAATEAKSRCGRATLSVATSATLPAHRAAFGRDKRDPPDASHSFRSRQARPSRRIAQLSVATSATLPAHHAAFGHDKRDPPGAATLRKGHAFGRDKRDPPGASHSPAPGAARVLRVPSRTW